MEASPSGASRYVRRVPSRRSSTRRPGNRLLERGLVPNRKRRKCRLRPGALIDACSNHAGALGAAGGLRSRSDDPIAEREDRRACRLAGLVDTLDLDHPSPRLVVGRSGCGVCNGARSGDWALTGLSPGWLPRSLRPMAYRFGVVGHVPLRAAIFDVDGVLVDSPHEQAWRETLDRLMAGPWAPLALDSGYQPGSLTTERYQRAIAGRPRLDGARGGLEAVGIADPDDEHVLAYAAAKQSRLVDLIEREPPPVFDDAVTLLIGLRELGLAIATASASQNAARLLAAISLPDGRSLRDVLDADVSGLDAPGKPDPAIFIEAARRLGCSSKECFVVEDSVCRGRGGASRRHALRRSRPRRRCRRIAGERRRPRAGPARSAPA